MTNVIDLYPKRNPENGKWVWGLAPPYFIWDMARYYAEPPYQREQIEDWLANADRRWPEATSTDRQGAHRIANAYLEVAGWYGTVEPSSRAAVSG
jgi:hypothetical protein